MTRALDKHFLFWNASSQNCKTLAAHILKQTSNNEVVCMYPSHKRCKTHQLHFPADLNFGDNLMFQILPGKITGLFDGTKL